MRIVNTFISDQENIPTYTQISLAKARELNPNIQIDFISKNKEPYFDKLNINWVPQESLENSESVKQFNATCKFSRHGTPKTTYPSPNLFWHRTAERIFYLEAYLKVNKLENVFHFENDVLTYYPINFADTADKILVTQMSQTHTTFAFCYIPSHAELSKLCSFFNELLIFGEEKLMMFGYDHISEMSLLNMALRGNIVKSFPTIINETGTFVYDPGSYGQYFGGTNNGHIAGFIDSTHYIGNAILSRKIHPTIENKYPQTESNRIFNLHIHSKRLERFI